MEYFVDSNRYNTNMKYRRCGNSGLKLPILSLGMWHNFGSVDNFETATAMIRRAFDKGITHFDLANNYGPVPGSAEENFGRILKKDFSNYRDEMIISSKAGHEMWPGPYGDGSSRKNLISSLDQSLKRMQLEYVDVFYSHRYDGFTPIEETMQTLVDIVKQGKALYVGISKYPAKETQIAYDYLKAAKVPCLIHQAKYNMFTRDVEKEILPVVSENKVGFIAFSPLAQGLLTNKYLNGVPENSRASRPNGFLKSDMITPELLNKVVQLNKMAEERGQSLAQMALAWLLSDPRVTSVIIGSSSVAQLDNNLEMLQNVSFSQTELDKIKHILSL